MDVLRSEKVQKRYNTKNINKILHALLIASGDISVDGQVMVSPRYIYILALYSN